jgi:hypothetical protein
MKNAILVSVLTVVLVSGAAAVYAGPPVPGTYKSSLGHFDEGTATTSWGPGGYLGIGNILYGRSYAGGFTNDWTLGCAVVANATLIIPKFGASGQEVWKIDYAPGAIVTLGGPGNPWFNVDAVYTGVTDYYTEMRTVQYSNNVVTGAVSDHLWGAHLQNYGDNCVEWGIANGVLIGGTPPGVPPFNYTNGPGVLASVKASNYPDFPLAGCSFSAAGVGHWEDIRDITMTITGCVVGTQQSTWGAVKSMYR